MRLTPFTDFGLRALMRLAGDPERVFTTDELARAFGISRNHLTKVIREAAWSPGWRWLICRTRSPSAVPS